MLFHTLLKVIIDLRIHQTTKNYEQAIWSHVVKGKVESSWNVMVHGDARLGKWRGYWRMEWVASTLHTISEHGVSSITIANAHTSAASIRLNWRLCRFKCTRLFRRKTKSGFCACAITFQTQSTAWWQEFASYELLRKRLLLGPIGAIRKP